MLGICRRLPAARCVFTARHFSDIPIIGRSNSAASANTTNNNSNALLNNLCARIRFGGPMTVAQFMQEVVSHPRTGYYAAKDEVLGAGGDFVTSPEISQMFGECLSVWLLHEWTKMGRPRPLQLVELGPGRGTLMNDVLRSLQKLTPPEVLKDLSVHLVEISDRLRKQQEAQLCGYFRKQPETEAEKPEHAILTAVSRFGPTVHWYKDLDEVPRGFSLFLAHEFLDALPIHQFVRGPEHWHEVLIDLEQQYPKGNDKNVANKLRFVKSRQTTPNCVHVPEDEKRDSLEVSPQTGKVVDMLCDRITVNGGAALIADYGHCGEKEITLRAFKDHQLQDDPLENPGQADVTADVDFSYVKRRCSDTTLCYGPVGQGDFLKKLGIDLRKDSLLKKCKDDATKAQIESSFRMLTDPKRMGERFKFLSIFPATMKPIHEKYPPAGFEEEQKRAF